MKQILELQLECMADDVPIADHMTSWTEAQVLAFFESGGEDIPMGWEHCHTDQPPVADLSSLALNMREKLAAQMESGEYSEMGTVESGKSTKDGWQHRSVNGVSEAPTIPYADLHSDDLAGHELQGDEIDEEFDTDGELRVEDALLDDPMSSIPVTSRTSFVPQGMCSQDSPSFHRDRLPSSTGKQRTAPPLQSRTCPGSGCNPDPEPTLIWYCLPCSLDPEPTLILYCVPCCAGLSFFFAQRGSGVGRNHGHGRGRSGSRGHIEVIRGNAGGRGRRRGQLAHPSA